MFGKTSLTKDIDNLQQQLDESMEKVKTLMEENESYKTAIASFPGVKQSYDSTVEKMQKEHEAKVKVLEAKLQETELSVNQKVNESLACIGVTTFPTETIIGISTSPAEAMDQFNSLSGIEKTEYYRKHKEEISRALSTS